MKRVIALSQLTSIKSFIAIGSGNPAIAKEILDGVEKVQLVMYSGGPQNNVTDTALPYPEKYNGKYIAASSQLKYGAKIGRLTFTVKDGKLEPVDKTGLVEVNANFTRDVTAASFLQNLTDSNELRVAKEPVIAFSRVYL